MWPTPLTRCLRLLEVPMTFEKWLEAFGTTEKARSMWVAQCAVSRYVSPPPASRKPVVVATVMARVPNSVFALGGLL